ncbi:MAG: hypothetical protein ABEI86_14590 [Halobacteriaceae archaeon]
MTCNKESQATFEFPEIGLEIKPFTVDYRQNVGKFDYAQATFSEGVGDYLNEHIKTEIAEGWYDPINADKFVLSNDQPVLFKLDGYIVDRLYFSPDFITVGDTTTIEFHDPIEYLQGGVVDIKDEDINLKDIYRRVFNYRKKSGNQIFTDIKFTLPDNITENIIGRDGAAAGMAQFRQNRAKAQDEDTRLFESGESVDLSDVSPLEGIVNLNNLFGLSAWADDYGTLWIGSRESVSGYHLAAQNDDRVWKISTPHIAQPRKPVKQVTVKGAYIDGSQNAPGTESLEEIYQFLDDNSSQKDDDYRSVGIAKREDIEYGKTFSFDAKDANRQALPIIALKKFYQKRHESKNGSVTINANDSGTEVSRINELKLGDIIELVPPTGSCGDTFKQDFFRVNGITHRIDGMQWMIDLDIQVFVDESISSELKFLNPRNGNYITPEQLFG